MTPCTAPGCTREARARGLCTTHYRRTLRSKRPDLTAPVRRRDLVTVCGLRLTPECAARLEREAKDRGLPLYRVTADVLETWAAKKNTKAREGNHADD